jgi:protein-disulfide isomerase
LFTKIRKFTPLILVLGIIAFVIFALKNGQDVDTTKDKKTVEKIDKIEGDNLTKLYTGWSTGSTNNKVVLTEFGDFQCPGCGAYYPVIKNLEDKYKDKLKIVFKNLPLVSIHDNAMSAALAAESAGSAGKFWAMYDKLYINQAQWSSLGDPTDVFIGYAKEIGMDSSKMKNDIKNKKYKDKIDDDIGFATALDIGGTPAFFINGERFEPQSKLIVDAQKELEQAIDTAISKNP